jgi:hypothetical protein
MDKEIEEDNKTSKSFPINIKYTSGSEDIISVFPEYTVGQLKTIVCTKKNLDSSRMVFVLAGKEIKDNQESLEKLNIHKNTIIYAVKLI